MRFTTILYAAMATLTIASPVALEARDANAVVAAIQTIEDKTTALTNAISTFKAGQVIQALGIQGKSDDAAKAIDAATNVCKQQTVFNIADSTTVGLKVLNELKPQVTSLIDILISKKSAFQNVFGNGGDFTFLAKYNLQNSRTKSTAFGNALIAILDPSFAGIGKDVAAQIDAEFARGLAAYS